MTARPEGIAPNQAGSVSEDALKPCPFCGSAAMELIVDDEEWEIARVECRRMTCRASGPHVDLGDFLNTEEAKGAAADNWNMRLGSSE